MQEQEVLHPTEPSLQLWCFGYMKAFLVFHEFQCIFIYNGSFDLHLTPLECQSMHAYLQFTDTEVAKFEENLVI